MKFKSAKLIVFSSICGFILLSIWGCSKESDPIKIGVIGTMSGINSDLSVSGRRGV